MDKRSESSDSDRSDSDAEEDQQELHNNILKALDKVHKLIVKPKDSGKNKKPVKR
jgi:hypothetical protein